MDLQISVRVCLREVSTCRVLVKKLPETAVWRPLTGGVRLLEISVSDG